jgi:putative copper export protein
MSTEAERISPRRARPSGAGAALVGLGASAAMLAVAPALMATGYSWVSRTTSESAAQGVSGAWLGRLGFLLFGLSVLLLCDVCRRPWGRWGTALHAAFGALMTAAAAFSHRPWRAGQAFDRTEDLLHSVAATGMGIAFAAGVVAVALRRGPVRRRRVPDVVAVGAAVALPLAMSVAPALDGLLQRLMFVVAYGWYAVEAIRAGRPEPHARDRSAAASGTA